MTPDTPHTNRPDNQDWLTKLLDTLDFDLYQLRAKGKLTGLAFARERERLKAEAHKIITTKLAEARLDELKRLSFTDVITDETKDAFWPYVKSRYAELEAALRGGTDDSNN